MNITQAIEAVYEAMSNENEGLNDRISDLKAAIKEEGAKSAVFDPARLVQNNREGRKRMQSYFKKRGVTVVFEASA
tara:strand:+ start:44988 stop:45215 length:228 start_codon:yes stop_codon:yes gene_type:complete